ncbi:MAG: flavodoxin family protein [Nitrospiraceae bacterium]|nr:flavodoxin family protein [Nitrospiraceae bacterium]
MKIISLLASPHGLKGNTAGLLRLVLDGAESEGAQAETVILRGNTVLPCLGCDACHKKGSCAQKDDFEPLKDKILAADGLVLASPNYIFNVSAQLKAFMDRCCGVIHCMSFWGKYGASVVTSGGGDDEPITQYMNHFLITTGAVPVGGVGATMSSMPEGDFTDEVKKSARALGKRLVEAWRAKTVPPQAEKRRNEFRQRIHALVAYRKEEWPHEFQYWKERTGA